MSDSAAAPAAPAAAWPALSTALIPRATYRFQFHGGFRFDEATRLVPYLQALGISHLYASPYLKARAGSTHGYDIVDHNALNPEIGSEADFEQLCATLQAHGLSQLLDVVPNHMGVLHNDNTWWLDVVEHGPASAWANFFDIDWEPSGSHMSGQVLLPVLGAQYGEILEAGELQLVFDTEVHGFRVRYFEHSVPIDPRDYAAILSALPMPAKADAEARREVQALIDAFARLPTRHEARPALGHEAAPRARAVRQRDQALHKRVLAQLYQQHAWMPKWVAACAAAFDGKPGDPRSRDALDALIGRQAWRLAYWRVASDEVNYRRFFDVSTLAAMRMERPEVFDATHRTLLRWLEQGKLSGLRIDHPDGLAEPARYFERLQAAYVAVRGEAAPGEAPRALYLLIEKILAGHERWPDGWQVHGDTGYRFSNLANAVFVDSRSEQAFDRLYADFIGRPPDYEAELIEAKRHIIFTSLAADLHMLTEAAYRLAQAKRSTRDYTRNGLRSALVELAAGMPVYRTYIGEDGVNDVDRRHLDWAAATARRRGALSEDATLAYLCGLMTDTQALSDERLQFIRRFQQFTSPVMAKAMEDTAFYRYHRLISLNDVGGEPLQFGIGTSSFHSANKARERHMPHCMLASSTHDSKRSEDLRARLDVLSEMPQAWAEALQRWRELRRRQVASVEGEPALDANDELLLYQTLVGVWPLGAIDAAGLAELRGRVKAFMQKALREAKQRSSWTGPNEAYEAAVTRCIDSLLGQLDPNPFLTDLRTLVDAIVPFGCANSLNLVALKLTSPGVPDIYQGCEHWNFSLVDPDNRRPVDYAPRIAQLQSLQSDWSESAGLSAESLSDLRSNLPDGRLKLLVTWRLLQLRAQAPRLFERGTYTALEVIGPASDHVIAYARSLSGAEGAGMTLTVCSRLLHTLYGAQRESPFSGKRIGAWLDTAVVLPADVGAEWRDVITGHVLPVQAADGRAVLRISDVLTELPLAQLVPVVPL